MSQLAFVIDQNRCIGCHACTVEHGVEIGVFRTWVKYIERGEFPDTRRHFSGLRCNHRTDSSCVKACPTTALFKRHDGIVDFDPERCSGCKACMNACPYDALYIDPESETAAKCNFCAHRIELDLKPSCEVPRRSSGNTCKQCTSCESGRQDLNLRPPGPQPVLALSRELDSPALEGSSGSRCAWDALILDPALDPAVDALTKAKRDMH